MKENTKKSGFYAEISRKEHERRMKSEYSEEELEIYHRGKKDAFIEILQSFSPKSSDIYQRDKYSVSELGKFCHLQVRDLRGRLEKAKKIYLTQVKIIENLSQFTID